MPFELVVQADADGLSGKRYPCKTIEIGRGAGRAVAPANLASIALGSELVRQMRDGPSSKLSSERISNLLPRASIVLETIWLAVYYA
jgi:hypothetical protein